MASADIAFDIIARDRASNTFDKVGRSSSGAMDKLKKFGKIAAAAMAAAGAAAVIVGKKLIDAGERASTSNARIQQVADSMGLFGDQANNVSNRLVKLAEKQALATGMDQNAIKLTQAKLLTFKELAKSADTVGGSFDRATAAAVDMAAAGFGTAEMNAVQLGKALNDPIRGITALNRSGITFSEDQKKVIESLVNTGKAGKAQEIILKAIETQVGGTAEATANATDQIAVGWSLVQERLGQKLLPVFNKVAAWIVEKGLPGAEKLAGSLSRKLSPAFAAVGRFINDRVIPAAQEFNAWFMEKIVPGLRRYATPILQGVRDAFRQVAEKVRENRPELEKVLHRFRAIAEFIADKVLPILGKLSGVQLKLLGKAIGQVIDFVFALNRAFDAAIGKIGDLIGWIKKIPKPDLGGLADKAGGFLSNIPFLAKGVTNFRGGLAVVGETGPELVRLPRGSDVIPASKTASIMDAGGGTEVLQPIVLQLDGRNLWEGLVRLHRTSGGQLGIA